MRLEGEPCAQQLTSSCEGCPVLSILRDELRNETEQYDVKDRGIQTRAAMRVAGENCPTGLIPDIEQLVIKRKGNGWTGRYDAINLR